MNWRILLLRSTVVTPLSFDVLANQLKRKTSESIRFKMGYIDQEDINIYYYHGLYEKLGLDRVPTMQVITTSKMMVDGMLTIKFRTATLILVQLGIVAALVLGAEIFIIGVIGSTWPLLVWPLFHLFAVIDFTKQLSHFKDDLRAIEKVVSDKSLAAV